MRVLEWENWSGKLGQSLAAAVLVFIIVGVVQPFSVSFIAEGADPSWIAATAYAVDHHFVFGEDFIFTSGPLASGYTFQYSDVTLLPSVILRLALACYVVSCLAVLAARAPLWYVATIVIVIACASLSRDAVFLLMPLLFVLLNCRSRRGWVFTVFSASLMAGLTCAKVSLLPVSMIAAVLVDVLSLRRGSRLPLSMITYIAAIFGVFVLLDLPATAVPQFLAISLEVSSGYSGAMSIAGPQQEVILWLVCAGGLMGIMFWSDAGRLDFARVVAVIISIVYLWICFKQGFVRHDRHSLAAWSALLSLTGVAGAALVSRRGTWAPAGALILIAIVAAGAGNNVRYGSELAFQESAISNLSGAGQNLKEALSLLNAPMAWKALKKQEGQRRATRLAAERALTDLSGTVDVIPSRQSEIIAQGLQYHPRPSIQEYATYTPELIDRNTEFFRSSRAPDHLFMAPGSIDGRYPASAEGASWKVILGRYRPDSIEQNMLLMHKRSEPVDMPLRSLPSHSAALGDVVDVPGSEQLVFAELGIRLSALGRLWGLLYKPAEVWMRVMFADGRSTRYRLIPGQAAKGFLISPAVETTEQFALLYSGEISSAGLREVKSLAVEVPWYARWQYQPRVDVRFDTLSPNVLARLGEKAPAVAAARATTDKTAAIVAENEMKPPRISLGADGVFAHAPAKLKLQTGAANKLEIAFGIREGAYTGEGDTNGVCFLVRQGDVDIFKRCLDPLNEPKDRGVQTAVVDVPSEAALELVTDCRGKCAWDWSYWSRARLDAGGG